MVIVEILLECLACGCRWLHADKDIHWTNAECPRCGSKTNRIVIEKQPEIE